LESRFSELISRPLSQDFTPTPVFLTGSDRVPRQPNKVTIYVEPQKAPGLRELHLPIRRLLKLERGTSTRQYAALSGKALKKASAPGSLVEDLRDEHDAGADLLAKLQYRLYAVDSLKPVGYCCFKILVSRWIGFGLELDEIWLKPNYRGRGLGMVISSRVADLAVFSLKEVEARARDQDIPVTLDIRVSGDVYSESGELFVHNVAESLELALGDEHWSALSPSDVSAAAYW
jgi:GNAT superfamily N-acetyltransferase